MFMRVIMSPVSAVPAPTLFFTGDYRMVMVAKCQTVLFVVTSWSVGSKSVDVVNVCCSFNAAVFVPAELVMPKKLRTELPPFVTIAAFGCCASCPVRFPSVLVAL